MVRKLQVEVRVDSKDFPVSFRKDIGKSARRAVALVPAGTWRKHVAKNPRLSVSIALVNTRTIQKLNRVYRKKDRATDVLSFPGFPAQGSLGDIAICWSVAKAQTSRFETTPRTELQRLVVHGVLHLLGYDHEGSAAEAKKMFALQEKVLRTLN